MPNIVQLQIFAIINTLKYEMLNFKYLYLLLLTNFQLFLNDNECSLECSYVIDQPFSNNDEEGGRSMSTIIFNEYHCRRILLLTVFVINDHCAVAPKGCKYSNMNPSASLDLTCKLPLPCSFDASK